MRRTNSKFTTKFISEQGSLPVNQDYFGFAELDNFACWAIAQGYDNDRDMESAQLAVDTIINEFTKKPSMSKRRLKTYIKEANRQIKLQSGRFRRKASVMVVVSNYNKMRYAGCGNCRINLFRGDNILARSADTSLYEELLQKGDIVEDGKMGMEESRNLHSFLGRGKRLKVKCSRVVKLHNDDCFLMSTWGFWEKVTRLEMLDALDGAKDVTEYISELQDLFLSKQTRHVNNYTIAAVSIGKVFQEKDNKRKYIRIAIILAIILIIFTVIFLIVRHNKNTKRMEIVTAVTEFQLNGDTFMHEDNLDRALNEYTQGVTESKKLKAITGKKGKQNTSIKKQLAARQRTAQLLIDGDDNFSQKKYDEAQKNYRNALKEAKNDLDFYESLDSKEIEAKAELCKTCIYVGQLLALAEAQGAVKDYENMFLTLDEAKLAAQESEDKDILKDVTLKMAELQSQITEEEEQAKSEEEEKAKAELDKAQGAGQVLELEGDAAMTLGNYEGAISKYNEAIEVYKQAGIIEMAVAAQKKISDVNVAQKAQENEILSIAADNYVMTGDNAVLDNNFSVGIESYKQARNLYAQIKMTDKVAEVTEKINLAKSSQQENDIAAKKVEIGVFETKGDEAVKQKDYTKALEYYLQAKTLYQDGNQMESVLNVDNKIKSVNELQSITETVPEEMPRIQPE